MSQVQVTILAAGMGTRLGRPFPKPLTRLASGQTIMEQQVDNIKSVFGDDVRIMIVVGFKNDSVMEHQPDAVFVYNEVYDQTNTSKSLLKALKASHEGSVIWMNGDVVFDKVILERLTPFIVSGRSAVAVNTSAVAEEEVKYTVDDRGHVRELSKTVVGGLGEAVGHQPHRGQGQERADPPARGVRGPGLLRARYRAGHRARRRRGDAGGHLGPVRRRGGLRG